MDAEEESPGSEEREEVDSRDRRARLKRKSVRKLSSGKWINPPALSVDEEEDVDMEEEEDIINAAEIERKKLYDAHLQRAQKEFKKLEDSWNSTVVSQTTAFLASAEQILLNKGQQGSTTPVAFVPSGLSAEEDKRAFDMMEAEVLKYTSLIARISALKCSTVKTAFQTICKQLESFSSTTPRALKEELQSRFGGPTPELIAVIVEKAEYFTKSVLPQLLQLLSTVDLPFLFIVGVNHCVGNFSRFIPPNCSTTFVYSEFETVSSTQRLNQVFNTVLDADLGPVTLGGNVVKFLSHFFMTQHGSVSRLLQAYRLCLLEHYRKPESILCRVPPTQPDHSSDERFAKAAGVDGITTGKLLTKGSNESWATVVNWNFLLRIISSIEASVYSKSSFDTFKDLYISCSRGTFFEPTTDGDYETPYSHFVAEIKRLTKPGLTRVINRLCRDIGLEDCPDGFVCRKSDLYLTKSKVPDIVGSLEQIIDDFYKLDEKEKENKPAEVLPKAKLKFKKEMSRDELKKMLTDDIATKSGSKHLRDFQDSFLHLIDNLVKTYLKPLPVLLKGVYYKAIVFDDLGTLKSLFSPDPLALVTNSLTFPSQILECKCCADVAAYSNVPSLPDTSIVFKLLKEQTNKKVDLNSLFQAFLSILETEQEGRSRRASIKLKKLDENSCLLRFRQSLAELQFTGILKRSRANPDEITKLIW